MRAAAYKVWANSSFSIDGTFENKIVSGVVSLHKTELFTMGRNRNDSGGSFNHAQMRASFTDLYRKRIGKQDVKKNVKVNKDTIKKNDMKINSSSLYRDIFIIIGVLLLIFCSLYYVFNVILVELNDIIPSGTEKTEV